MTGILLARERLACGLFLTKYMSLGVGRTENRKLVDQHKVALVAEGFRNPLGGQDISLAAAG